MARRRRPSPSCERESEYTVVLWREAHTHHKIPRGADTTPANTQTMADAAALASMDLDGLRAATARQGNLVRQMKKDGTAQVEVTAWRARNMSKTTQAGDARSLRRWRISLLRQGKPSC